MNSIELKDKIRSIVLSKYSSIPTPGQQYYQASELTKIPELKQVILSLLTDNFNNFLSSIDWVAPKPTTFRINLKNDKYFYLIWNDKSWVAQISGKKYYLLNLPEEERALQALSKLLRLRTLSPEDVEDNQVDFEGPEEGGGGIGGLDFSSPPEETSGDVEPEID